MNRNFGRRVAREWNKIRLGKPCTKFVERNHLFTPPYVIYYQAVKVGDDVMCVYSVAIFDFKEGCGYLEFVTVCLFIDSLFRGLSSMKLGFISEKILEQDEEIE